MVAQPVIVDSAARAEAGFFCDHKGAHFADWDAAAPTEHLTGGY